MYEAFYNLSTDPFKMSPDHRFAFPHPSYARARSYLEYGLFRGEGLVVVTGQPGTGKSTVIEDLLAQYGDESLVVARLFTTQLEVTELLRLVANALGINTKDADKASLLIRLERFLNTNYDAGRRVLLIIDEAQNLSQLALEELRLLTNIQRSDGLYFQIFLLGQPQLQNLIRGPGMEQLRQRIIASSHFKPLTAKEVRSYIEHRLSVAGWQGDPEISGEALQLIHRFSGGIPRRVNLLCSRLLLYGSVDQKHQLEGQDILQVIEDMPPEMIELGKRAPVGEPPPPRPSAPASEGGTSKYDVWQSAFRKAAANTPARPSSQGNEVLDTHAELTPALNHPTVALDIGPAAAEAAESEPLASLSVEAPAREEQPETAPARPPVETTRITEQGPEVSPLQRPEPPIPKPQTRPTRRPPEPQATEMLDEPTLPRLDDPPRRPIDAWEPETRAPRRGARPMTTPMALLLFVAVFALTYLALNWYWGDLPGVVTRLETTLPTQILEMLRSRTASQESAPLSSARPEQTQAEVADDTSATGTVPTTPQERVPAVPENWTRIGPETGAAPPPSPVKEGVTPPAEVPSDQPGAVVSESTAESDLAPSHKAPVHSTRSAAKEGPDAGVNRVGNRSVISRSLEGGLRRQGFKTALLSNGQLKVTLHREVPFRSGAAKLDKTAIQHLDKLAFVLRNYDGFRVKVIAHTDSSGEDQQNLELSQRRARIVANHLIQQGLPASRVSAEGRGESEPLLVKAGNGYDPRLDRRIEVFLIPES
jgi:putative secretion ATPase (PEP-CTERM system associated)